MALFTVARALAIGSKIASKKSRGKPKMNGKKFKKGMEDFGEKMALGFMKHIEARLEESYSIPLLNAEFTKKQLYDTLMRKKALVVVKKESFKSVEIPYKEIWYFFEYGRLDKGILPQPVLNKLYREYREVYKASLKKELTHKRKKR